MKIKIAATLFCFIAVTALVATLIILEDSRSKSEAGERELMALEKKHQDDSKSAQKSKEERR